jgi:dihydropteroate synthase
MLCCGQFNLSLDRPLVMGIVNLTPDSFSGDGLAADVEHAVVHAKGQIAAGADILDIGAESSRPGAIPLSLDDELNRLLPVLNALRDCGVPISVDTYKPEVMRAAVAAGASMINDIYGFRMPGAFAAVASSNCAVCIMHMQGEPLTMQKYPKYDDVVDEVRNFLELRAKEAVLAGITQQRIVIDPGYGFGKDLSHNRELLRRQTELSEADFPLLVGMSRKTMLGQITGRPVGERVSASVTAALLAAQRGAKILRVHDVAATCDALAVWRAIETV